jgi:molecular chaperone GrpE
MRQPYSRDTQQMVPRQLAEKIVRERDAVAEELRRYKAEHARLARQNQELAAQLDAKGERVGKLEHALAAVAAHPVPTEAADSRVQRLSADLANLRRRQNTEIERRVRHEKRAVLQDLLSVRDSLSQALDTSADEDSTWYQGTAGILHQFDEALRRQGAHRIGHIGEAFNPAHHEAIGMTQDGVPGQVTHVARPGFAWEDGDLIRPAQVLVPKEV